MRTLLIALLVLVALPISYAVFVSATMPGVLPWDVFRGEIDVVQAHSAEGPEFKVSQKVGDFYGWTMWYRLRPADRWKVLNGLENDGPRLYNAALTYDRENDTVVFRSGLEYKSEIRYEFDGTHTVKPKTFAPIEP